jgi:hypothetical protein
LFASGIRSEPWQNREALAEKLGLLFYELFTQAVNLEWLDLKMINFEQTRNGALFKVSPYLDPTAPPYAPPHSGGAPPE